MNLKILIDGIVQQTTVLIAQLSTAAGVRAPLSNVADQVFLELAREIERQGVRRSVVADMFGLALRTYQKKMQRLTESVTTTERTLWEAVLDFIGEETPTRAAVLSKFDRDGEKAVGAVLKDLVRSGLVFKTGSGASAVYGATTDIVRSRVLDEDDVESIANVIWLGVFRGDLSMRNEIAARLGIPEPLAERAVRELVEMGRLVEAGGERLISSNVAIPLGIEHGWEASVLDHYRAVARAIGARARAGFGSASASERVGGSTFTFTVGPGHPHEERVYTLLRTFRAMAQSVWDDVAAYNDEHAPDPRTSRRVTFYMGQSEEQPDE